MPRQTPHDLAVYVYRRLADTPQRPSSRILDEIFHTLYLASLRREEGTPITCSIAYVNPRNPDPLPPATIRDPRWTFTKFRSPVDYSSSQLTKLAFAADPTSSCLVVYPNRKGVLQIWGLLDQQGGFQSMLSYEAKRGLSPPGVFHVQILEAGHLVVMDGPKLLAELNGDHLVEDSVDVFINSAIRKKLRCGFDKRIKNISAIVEQQGYEVDSDLFAYAYPQWIKIIRRILLRARTFSQGGAFLFTDSMRKSRLSVKYDINYDRIPILFENYISYSSIEHQSHDHILDMNGGSNHLDPEMYLSNTEANYLHEDANDAISGAVAFIASLSRVDGLVLLDYDLNVHGFGCEITAKGDKKCQAYHATHSSPTKGKLRRLDIQGFGTRHRSMVRYCMEDKNSVGFVVSHDGPVRAISSTSSRLYFWDNVQLSPRS